MPEVVGAGEYGIFVRWKILDGQKNKTQILRYVKESNRNSDFSKLKSNSNVDEVKKLGR